MNDYEHNLADLRSEINNLDNELLDVLSRRFDITHQVGQLKVANRLPIKDEQRESYMLERLGTLAKNKGLDPKIAQDVMKVICQLSVSANTRLANERYSS